MNFIVSSSNLLKQLQAISGVLASNNTLPILDNFLFVIKEKELKVTASDLETTFSATVMLEQSKEDGVIAIPAKLLLETLKTFAEQPLTFSVNEKFGIEISSDNGSFKLGGLNGADYPKIPVVESDSALEINSEVLYSAIDKTLFATGNDELRPVMSGVLFQLSGEGITFVATDAHKLVRYIRKDIISVNTADLILPKKPLNLLKGILSSYVGAVKLEFNEANAFFQFENIELICRLVDGKYPNYDAVIPKENPNKLIIDRSSFLNSIRRISIFSNKSTHQVKLKIAGSELSLSAEDLDFENAANERITCNYEGEDISIGFNSKFLLEMLNNLKSDNVILELSDPSRAGILFPEVKENENEDVLMLVMPVMINN